MEARRIIYRYATHSDQPGFAIGEFSLVQKQGGSDQPSGRGVQLIEASPFQNWGETASSCACENYMVRWRHVAHRPVLPIQQLSALPGDLGGSPKDRKEHEEDEGEKKSLGDPSPFVSGTNWRVLDLWGVHDLRSFVVQAS